LSCFLRRENSAADKYFKTGRLSITAAHNDLIAKGNYKGASIIEIFRNGAYVDARELAVLNTAIDSTKRSVSIEQLANIYEKQLFAGLINRAWRENGAYLVSFSMTEAECWFSVLPVTN
jgi:hypothetical protein